MFPESKPNKECDQKGDNEERISGPGMPRPMVRPLQHLGIHETEKVLVYRRCQKVRR